MHTSGTWRLTQLLLLACIAFTQNVHGSVATTTAFSVSDRTSTTVRVPTCHSVSVNYVSPGLPQQCLRTRSTARTTATSSDGIDASSLSGVSGVSVDSATTLSSETSASSIEHTELSSLNSSDGASVSSPTSILLKPSDAVKSTGAEDSPLDTAKFLSFEEWKIQNLAKAGQSSESFAQRAMREPRTAPGSANAALDGLGWEMALDFGDGSPDDSTPEKVVQVSADPKDTESSLTGAPIHRSPDAGKTCKERFNYASFDCAATVHKHNKEGKGPNSILVENKESYMLNKCEAKEKFFIVELCNDILVDTVVLANFEFFSSVFKELRVSVSDRYPVKANGWRELGTFVARNTRDVQAFLIENPLIWARYIKVDLLSHYGNEYYCPVSLFRVHGTTMMEEYRHQVEAPRTDADIREELAAEAVAEKLQSESHVSEKSEEDPSKMEQVSAYADTNENITSTAVEDRSSTLSKPVGVFIPRHSQNPRLVFFMVPLVCPSDATEWVMTYPETVGRTASPTQLPVSGPEIRLDSSLLASQIQSSASSNDSVSITASMVTLSPKLEPRSSSPITKTVDSSSQDIRPSASQPPLANPTTQESFFKSVHKRLTHLEGNSTLSLQYIEEQSRILRDAFAQMEKKQLARVDQVLKTLNLTAFGDLRNYREKYDQLWQSTVIALEGQREYTEREMGAISSRLSLLADEVIFQKRMYQLNTVLLLVTLGIVLFSRNEQLAMPLVQHLRTRSSARIFDSPPNSPPLQSSRPFHHRANSSDSANSMTSPVVQYSPPTPVEYASRESSPVFESKNSPPTPVGGRSAGKGWIQFGPQLRVETRGRRWQRLPSPLGSVDDDESNEVSEALNKTHQHLPDTH